MKSQALVVAAAVGCATVSVASAEVIGSFDVRAADSAVSITAANPNGWLNTANTAIDVNASFSGAGIVDDGIANIEKGETFEVTFNTAVTNVDGADLVLFDARFDNGEYSVSASHDGFSASLSISEGVFVDTGETRAYYYGANEDGPFTAEIWAAAIDLSDLGVALGDSITSFRFTSTNTMADPLGVGAIIPAPATVGGLGLFALAAIRRRR